MRKRAGLVSFICVASSMLLIASSNAQTIPLQAGLTLVETGPGKKGDYEAVYHIDAVSNAGVAVSLSTSSRESILRRFVRRIDLVYAHRCMCSWSFGQPRIFAGTTAIGTSAAVLRDLRDRGTTLFVDMWQQPDEIAPYRLRSKQRAGTLYSVRDQRKTVTALVNDQLVRLPVLRATGNFGDVRANFIWLDNPDNPLLIHGDIGGGGGRLVKMYLPAYDLATVLQRRLQQRQPATLYGVYFDADYASLRVQSSPTLQALAGVMRRNPSWRFRLAVYTDNLGGWDANLILAKARARQLAAVLTRRYGVGNGRMEIMGAGAADAVAGNLTVAGRALNRRVVVSRY